MKQLINQVTSFLKGLTEAATCEDAYSENEYEKSKRLSGITYYYLELYLHALPRNRNYNLSEELRSGVIVRHLADVSWTDLADYIESVFIPDHPPMFVITEV